MDMIWFFALLYMRFRTSYHYMSVSFSHSVDRHRSANRHSEFEQSTCLSHFVYLCAVQRGITCKIYLWPLCSVHTVQSAWCSRTRFLSVVCTRLRVEGCQEHYDTWLLLSTELVESERYSNGQSWGHCRSSFDGIQLFSQPCTSSERQYLIFARYTIFIFYSQLHSSYHSLHFFHLLLAFHCQF